MRPALREGWLYVPEELVGPSEARASLREQLTHTSAIDEETGQPILLRLYDESRSGYLGVPRAFGVSRFRDIPVEDRTTIGSSIVVPKRPDPNHPRVRNPAQQAKFMRELHAGLLRFRTLTATAPTGSGKTVCFLDAAAALGRTTLILVHLERLMHQWIDEIQDKLGVPRERIGIVQQNRCEFEGKDFVVGLLHSVVRRDYPEEFYRWPGLVGFDEVHKVGSQYFAPAVSLFPSRYKLALSATLNRRDGGDKVYFWHIGPVRVTSEAEALPIRVNVVDYRHVGPDEDIWGRIHGSRMKCLSQLHARNVLLARIVKRFYDSGRQALVVAEGVRHLQRLMGMAEKLGVPRSAMGQFTSEIHRKVEIVDPATRQKHTRWVKAKQSKQALDRVKAHAQIIFATYGMMTEGIDIPRLDAGVDATPRGSATQLIGRIRRPVPGKRKPVWITIRDVRCSMSMRYFKSRCKDYAATNAEVVYGSQKAGTHDGTARGTPQALVGSPAQRAAATAVPIRSGLPRQGAAAGAGNLPQHPWGGAGAQLPHQPAGPRGVRPNAHGGGGWASAGYAGAAGHLHHGGGRQGAGPQPSGAVPVAPIRAVSAAVAAGAQRREPAPIRLLAQRDAGAGERIRGASGTDQVFPRRASGNS